MLVGRIAVAAIFLATSFAATGTKAETVTLTVTVSPFLAIDPRPMPVSPAVSSESGPEHPQDVSFRVVANVAYAMELRFASWQAEPAGPVYAAFTNGHTTVSGVLSLEGSNGAAVMDVSGHRASAGSLRSEQGPGISDWRLSAAIDPAITDATTGLAPPGRYSLDVEITLLPQ